MNIPEKNEVKFGEEILVSRGMSPMQTRQVSHSETDFVAALPGFTSTIHEQKSFIDDRVDHDQTTLFVILHI